MLAQEVAHKYARALFNSVRQKNLLEQADQQFMAFKQLLQMDKTLLTFLGAPQVSDDKKLALVRKVFESRMERPFVEFLIVLIHKRRVKFLPIIIDEFDRLIKAAKGIGRVTVITAIPLVPAEENGLIEKLARKTSLKIELEKEVDPAILGGMIIILHDQIIDGSIRHGLKQIEDRLGKLKVN
jgi:F-type H+-transporting ATPase subunit delta